MPLPSGTQSITNNRSCYKEWEIYIPTCNPVSRFLDLIDQQAWNFGHAAKRVNTHQGEGIIFSLAKSCYANRQLLNPLDIKVPHMDDRTICPPWDKNFGLTPPGQTLVLLKIYRRIRRYPTISILNTEKSSGGYPY